MPKQIAPVMLLATIVACGCSTLPPAAKLGLRNALTGQQRLETAADTAALNKSPEPAAEIPTPAGPPPELTNSAAMAQVAPVLAELAAADPALHAEVLQQLSGTQPHLWSLTVQRAKNLLEYQQQVIARQAVPVASDASTVVQASATTPVAPLPPPLPTILAAQAATPPAMSPPTAPRSATPPPVTANPFYTASATVPAAPAPQTVVVAAHQAKPPSPVLEPPAPKPLPWQDHLAKAITRFQETEGTKPKSRNEAQDHIRLRLLQLAAGQNDEAAVAPPGLPPSEQGYWSNQLWAMSTLLQSKGEDFQAKVDAANRHQEQASAKLSELGALQIRSLTPCEVIYGYGAYEPIREASYRPGEAVSLYAEIKNYRSDATDEGYHALIGCSYRLIDTNGNEAIMQEMPAIDDLCLSRRRDFHLSVAIPLPTGLREGEYRLELTVTDRLANKTDRSELPIRILRR